ncbi:MAG: hypothetical protein KDA58_16565 [Planctomycetaceae bacterium]|nr:hypothetical protein [Planctomycetaceae bacterium]
MFWLQVLAPKAIVVLEDFDVALSDWLQWLADLTRLAGRLGPALWLLPIAVGVSSMLIEQASATRSLRWPAWGWCLLLTLPLLLVWIGCEIELLGKFAKLVEQLEQ